MAEVKICCALIGDGRYLLDVTIVGWQKNITPSIGECGLA
jgi:hypothetical protein